MPQAVAAIAAKVGVWAANAAMAAATSAGAGHAGALAFANAVGATAVAVTSAAIYTGASYALNRVTAPDIPEPELATQSFQQTIPARRYGYGRARISGPFALREARGQVLYYVIALHDGRIGGIVGYYFHDDVVTLVGDTVQELSDRRYETSRAKLWHTLGLPTETAFSAIVSALPDLWTNDHRGDGVAMLAGRFSHGKLQDFPRQWPNGPPNVSVVADLSVVFDWRNVAHDRADPSTWETSYNPFVNLAHELTIIRGHSWDAEIEPVLSLWTAAADHCDGAVSLAAGGTEPRYQCGGVVDMTNDGADVMKRLLECCDGWLAPRGDGALIPYSGQYVEPTVTLVEGVHIKEYEFQRFQPEEEAVHDIRLSYCSPAHDWAMVDTDPWRDEEAITATGREGSVTLPLEWVRSNGQARRLAKRVMARSNAPLRGSLTLTLDADAVLGQRFVRVQLPSVGIEALADIVVELEDRVTYDLEAQTITVRWAAVDENVDAWNPATEEGNPPALEDKPPPDALVAPTMLDADVTVFFDGPDARLRLEPTGPDRDDLTWFARWRVAGSTSWYESEHTDVDPGVSVVLETGLVPINETLEVSAAYRTGSGSLSPWSTTANADSAATDPVPTAPTSLSADGGAGYVSLSWQNPNSASLEYVKVFRGTTTVFADATDISVPAEIPAVANDTMTGEDDALSAGTYYYWVQAFNAADVGSTPAGPDSATVT